MLFSFLNSADLEGAIKEEQLTQLVRDNMGLVAVSEASAVSRMKDYLGQRFDLAAAFPTVGDWSAGNDYAPAVALVLPAADPGTFLAQPLDYLTRPEPAVSGISYTPPFAYNPAGRLTNYAYHEGQYYQSLTASLGVEPGVTDGWETSWQARDPRAPQLVRFALDMALFMLFTRVAPRKIPDLRVSLYNEAKEWLTLVRDGNLTPDLPRPLKLADSSDEIRWGSNAPQFHYY